MVIPTIYSITVSHLHSNQYDTIITNVSLANKINNITKNNVPNELWNIVSGRKAFNKGIQFKMLKDINIGIMQMSKNTKEQKGKEKLEVATRAYLTLYKNITDLGIQINNGGAVSKNEEMLDDIRGITTLLSDILQEYIILEIEDAAKTNMAIKKSSIMLTYIQGIILTIVIIFSIHSFLIVLKLIKKPISDMEILSTRIANGNLTSRLPSPDIAELKHLAINLNIMTKRIKELIEQNIEEQKNLQKAEMKSLQSQITPHFLYNTFDTIIWLAEAKQTEDVIKVTRAFSEFLRISLIKGHDWITIEQEISHISNYLTIQKIRYDAILNYDINIDKELFQYQILKLTLQPLVENAIYHGIKNKRGRGHINVRANYTDEKKDYIFFEVEDDGIGFKEEKLKQVNKEINLETKASEELTSVYGLYNVNKRLILYYNNRTDGLHIKSEYRKGTCVSFIIPSSSTSKNI